MKENNWLATLALAVYLAGKTVGDISGACLNPAIGLGINAAAALHQQLTRLVPVCGRTFGRFSAVRSTVSLHH